MKTKTVVLTSILGVTVLLSFASMNVMAEKDVPGPFATDKTERTMIKELVVGQREIKSKLDSLESKIGRLGICKE